MVAWPRATRPGQGADRGASRRHGHLVIAIRFVHAIESIGLCQLAADSCSDSEREPAKSGVLAFMSNWAMSPSDILTFCVLCFSVDRLTSARVRFSLKLQADSPVPKPVQCDHPAAAARWFVSLRSH
jgi:hypothetical protein